MTEPISSLQKVLFAAFCFAGIVCVGMVDYLTAFDMSLSVFYAVPVIFGVWFVGRWTGICSALLAVAAWSLADRLSGHQFSNGWIPIWNACVRLSFLMLIVTGAYYTRRQLQQTQARTVALERALPVCTCCKKIRDEEGAWLDVETFVMEHLATQPAQKLCPDCAKRVYIQKVSPQDTGTVRA
jgi:hypothetical protein